MKPRNLPTPEQAAQFDGFIAKWQTLLNLHDWRIERGTKAAKSGAMASVEFTPSARLAVYRLGDFGAETINAESLEKTALHEMLHVVTFDLLDVAQNKPSADELDAAEHRVINLFERLLYKGLA